VAIETASRAQRRRRSVEEKRRIVEETLAAGASVARVARRHAVNANQVFYWRQKYREGRLGKVSSSNLLPVTISEIPANKSGQVGGVASRCSSGTMEIQVAKGQLRVTGTVEVRSTAHRAGVFARMIGLPVGTKIWIAAGVTDLRR
jgi:transposase